MKTRRHFRLAATVLLVIGLSAGVLAQNQKKSSQYIIPPEPILPSASVVAIEVTDGVTGVDDVYKYPTAFGYSFFGQTTGGMPGSFTLAMNCTPAIPIPGDSSQLVSGSWTLPVYKTSLRGSYYAGSLYGTVAKGSMYWDKAGTGAEVYFVLNVDGGTQTWDGAKGYVSLVGNIYVDEKTQQTMLKGDLVFSLTGR